MNDQFIGKICIVRANMSGVFLGEVVKQEGNSVLLKDVRRLWKWEGAETVEDLATYGVAKPNECKIPVVVGEKLITNFDEITPATEQAIKSIMEVKIWTAHK